MDLKLSIFQLKRTFRVSSKQNGARYKHFYKNALEFNYEVIKTNEFR